MSGKEPCSERRRQEPQAPRLLRRPGSEDKGYALVTNGYRPLDDLLDPLERWWAAGAPVTAAAQ
jgi:hypothetical protein